MKARSKRVEAQGAQGQVGKEISREPSRAVSLLQFVGPYIMAIGATLATGSTLSGLEPQAEGQFSLFFSEVPLSVAILLIFIGSFIVGVRAAIAAKPPLLAVALTIKSQDGMQPRSTLLAGRLVAHSNSFWHLFDENNELLSIPDEQVLAVRMLGKADTLPAEEPEPKEAKRRKAKEPPPHSP
jgi:hypothetical protein